MKNNYLSFVIMLLILLFSNENLQSQTKTITKEEAWEIVQQNLLFGNISRVNAYFFKDALSNNSIIKTPLVEVISPDFSSWFFFVDTLPNAKWGHPCNWVFVNTKTGSIEIRHELFPPQLDNMQALISFKYDLPDKLVRAEKSEIKKGVCTNDNDYAIIISGGGYPSINWEASWNDCSAIYCDLVNNYHFDDDHIIVLMSDGTDPSSDRHLFSGGYDSSPLDLDGDQDNDINFSATYSNISSVFSSLANTLDSEDNLVIFVYDHGELVNEEEREANIILWNNNIISDSQFADMVDLVDAGKIFILMNQCYSGAFIDELEASNRVISTACDYDEYAYWDADLGYSFFNYHWVSAMDGETPESNPVDADYNDDGVVSISEAFYYAQTHDTSNEHPQHSTPNNLGSYLAISGKIPYLTGDDMVCYSSNKTFNLINYPSNTNVTWTCSENLFPYSSTTTSYTVHALSSSSTGFGWVQAYITDQNCNPVTPLTVRYSPWVGIPELNNISGPYEGSTNTHYNFYALPYNMEALASYYWSASPSSFSNYAYSNYSDFIFWDPSDYQISVRAQNICGSTDWIPTYTSIYSGERFLLYPNPATDLITITLPQSSGKETERTNSKNIYSIRIFDIYGKLYYSGEKTGNSLTIPVGNLRNGKYYFQIAEGNKITTLSFIKK